MTPDRIYAIVADSEEIRDGWLSLIADMIPPSEPVSSLGDSEPGVPKEVRGHEHWRASGRRCGAALTHVRGSGRAVVGMQGQTKAGVLEKKPADPKLVRTSGEFAPPLDAFLCVRCC